MQFPINLSTIGNRNTEIELTTSIKPMIDTNILVCAHNQDSPFYPHAKSLLTDLTATNGFYISYFSLHEFFSIITDGHRVEKPLASKNALSIINEIKNSKNIDLLSAAEPDSESGFFAWLENFISNTPGFQIQDALIAYTMYQNKIRQLYTTNPEGFKIFDSIKAINPFYFPAKSEPMRNTANPLIIPYGRQSISEKDVDAVCSVLRSDFLTQGPKVPEFEQAVVKHCGAKHGVAVNSATSALHIACLALGLGPGDMLWTSPITFVASANCALYCGATVDFVDIDPRTYNMSQDSLETKLAEAKSTGKLPKIVIPVHMCGQACDMEKIHTLSKKYGFSIIEDASHAIGGLYKNEPIGSCRYSDITVFSFHPVKIITTGEGGMAVSNDRNLAEKMALLRSHGITRNPDLFADIQCQNFDTTKQTSTLLPPAFYYQQVELGFNYRMTDIQASLGLSQLERLDEFVSRRRELAKRYDQLLSGLPLTIPWQHPDAESAWHLYVIRLNLKKSGVNRRQVFEYLRKNGIGVNVHYIPVHTQPWYRKMGFEPGIFPNAEQYYKEALTLPLFPAMTEKEQDRVVECLRMVLGKLRGL